jgi:zinc transport system substrate-binding protein
LLCVNLRTILIPVLVAGVVAAGCQEGPEADGGRISVVASFYPLQFVAERLGGDCVAVTNLTPPGVEPHDLELSPDAVESIVTADLVLYLGGGFQPAVEEALPDAEGGLVDGLAVVETGPAEGEAADEGLTVDPHIWLDPTRFAEIVGGAAAGLEAAGVAASCDVPAAADALRADLADLDEEFRTGLLGCDRDLLVTNHAAFGYLASAYGLRQEAIAGLEPDVEPSAKRIADLKDLVEREGVTTILTEELVSPNVAQTLAAETGAHTAVLFTIEGLSDEEVAAGEDYRSLMQKNLETLRVALGCP